jgi:2-methylcitrate dehydratase
MALTGEMGYPSALTAKTWGFYDVLFNGQPFKFQRPFTSYVIENVLFKGGRFAMARPLGSYVMEHVLFKVSFPAEFHAQTAVECAVRLHAQVKDRLDQIDRIVIETQESAVRIIDKTGPLNNYADRDHCIQYMTAVPLFHGTLTADMYADAFARDPRIDALRAKMQVVEHPGYTRDYLDPEKRSIANAVQIFFADGTSTERVEIEYPVGHRRRRAEAVPLLREKFATAMKAKFGVDRAEKLVGLFADPERLDAMAVEELMGQFAA